MSSFRVSNLRVHLAQGFLVPALLFVSGALVWSPYSLAQTAGVGQIAGVIADPSGATIPGAQIRVIQVETKVERVITSDEQGRYAVPALPVGPYQIEVTAGGFKTYQQSGIVLQVGSNLDINVSMQIGSNAERTEVTASAAMVETRDNAISQVIEQRRIVDLPLNGRQPTQLILLSGAATVTPSGDLSTSKSFYSSTTMSVAGGQGNAVNYLLDGADNNDAFTNLNLPIPFPDALQEFSVQTSSLPARFGLHPAAVVNAVTKSGTNSWHGSLFEFLRNGDVNARNFFAPVHDSLKRNQFGGTFGGRIIRDKLFFFGGFQGTYNRQNPPQSINFVPTSAVLNGDFSVIDSSACVAGGKDKAVIDPNTNLPFANNLIPVSRFDPASLKLVKLLPPAQNACGKVTYGIVSTGDEDQGIVRMDWVQSTKHTVYSRYYLVDYRNPAVFDGTDLLTATVPGNLERSQSATIGDTYTFSGNTLNSAHATFTRVRNNRGPAADVPNATSLGVNTFNPVANDVFASVAGYFNVGCNTCSPAFFNNNSYNLADDVDIIRGRHQIAFGATVFRNQFNSRSQVRVNGAFSFSGQYATGKTTDALAAFMLGAMDSFSQGDTSRNATRETVLGFYVQDSIRLTPHLTLNVGLRWDPALVAYDYFNTGSTFSQAAFNAGQRSSVFTNAPAGTLFYGDPGVPKGFQDGHWAQFSPRVGLVWDPTGSGRQSIRVSGAILRDTQELYYGEALVSNSPFGSRVTVTSPYPLGGTFSNPWIGYPGGDPFPLPSPRPSNITFPSAAGYILLPPQMKPMYMDQWSVSYQRELSHDWLATVSYVGNKTTHVPTAEDINAAQYIPGSTASTNLRRRLYLQNPAQGVGYGSMIQSDPNGNSNYNAMLLSIQHRFSGGFTLLTNYTWSHCLSDVDNTQVPIVSQYMNPNNRAADYGNCSFDVRQQTNTSLIVVSPIKGSGFAGRVFGQWQLAPIVSLRSGLPINITTGTDVSQTGTNLDRPNLVLPDAYQHTSNPLQYLNPAAFQAAAPGTFGNLGRNVLIGPGSVNVDMSLSRSFRLRERFNLTARAESFNVINHPNFPAPNTVMTNSQFGVITAASNTGGIGVNGGASAGDPRIFQFSLKLLF